MHTLTASDRSALIKLASSLPAGSAERKAILAGLQGSSKTAIIRPPKDRKPIPKMPKVLTDQIVYRMESDGSSGTVFAESGPFKIGTLQWQRKGDKVIIALVGVHDDHQRRGIAKRMVVELMSKMNLSQEDLIVPHMTTDGKAFYEGVSGSRSRPPRRARSTNFERCASRFVSIRATS